jgi:hypothetical protein
MTTIIKKMINDNAYFYAVKSARVNGKPRIVSQVYLGTADNIVEMKKQCESDSVQKSSDECKLKITRF